MTVTITHAKVSAVADNPKAVAAGQVAPSDWNAEHVIVGLDAAISANSDVAANTAARVPTGGDTGDILTKSSGTDYDTEWRAGAFLDIRNYGGVGDNSTDNAAALASALAALPTGGGTIYFPAGKYKFISEVTFTIPDRMFSLRIVGAGQDATILTWSSDTNGLTITCQNLGNSVHVSDLSITTSSDAGTGFGLSIVNNTITSGFQEGVIHNISNVTFQGDGGTDATLYWGTALYIQALNFVNIDSVLIYGGVVSDEHKGRGIVITDIADIIIGTFNLSRCVLSLLEICVLIGGNPQGVCLSQCTVIDSDVGLQTQTGTTTTQSLQVSNCNFANDLYNVFIETPINDVQISGTTFISNATATSASYSVYLGDVSGFTIAGNEWLSAADTDTKALGIGATNGWPGIICGNTIRGPFDIGIELSSDSSLVTAYPNAFGSTVTTPYSDSGTNNKIRAKVADGGTGIAAGTSGGIPYFDSTSTMASSAALAAHGVMVGGGAGASPSTITAMTDGQIAVGQTGANPIGKTISGDATLAASGALSVTKTGGVSFAASATTDTSNAANINSGTLPAARIDLTASYGWSGRHDFFNNVSSDNIRLGVGTNYYQVGRSTVTGYLDFDGTQTGFVGYNFKNGPIVANEAVRLKSYTVGTLPAGVAGDMAFATNLRVFNGAGTQEGAAAGTGGSVQHNGTAWKIAGTNVTAIA